MTRRRILLVISLAVVAVGAVLAWRRDSVLDSLERRLAHSLVALTPVPLRIGGLEIQLWPPGLELSDVVLEVEGENPVRIERIAAGVALLASVWEGEWIVDLSLERPDVVVARRNPWWESIHYEASSGGERAYGKLRSVIIRDARATVLLEEPSLELTIADLDARGRWRGVLDGELGFDLSAKGLVRSATAAHPIDGLDLVGSVSSFGLRIDRARLVGPGSEIEFAGSLDRTIIDGEVRGQLQLGVVGDLLPLSGIRGGAGKVRARIDGELSEPNVDAELSVVGLRIGAIELSGEAPLRAHGLDWSLGPGRVQIFGGEVEATANGRLAPGLPYVLVGKLKDWTARDFLRAIEAEVPLAGKLDGDAEIRGKLFADEVAGKGEFRLHRGDRALVGDVDFRVAEAGAHLEGTLGQGDTGTLTADLTFAARQNEGSIVVTGFDLATAAPFVDAPLAGRLDGKARFGDGGEPRLDGDITIDGLRFEQVEIGRALGPFALDETGIESAGLDLADLSAHLEGHLPWTATGPVNWNLQLTGSELARVAAISRLFGAPALILEGRVDGTMSGSGSRATPKLEVQWLARRVSIEGLDFDEIQGSFDGTSTAWKLEAAARGEDARETARVSLARNTQDRLHGTASIGDWSLSGLPLPVETSGILTAEATIAGTVIRPIVESTFSLTELAVARREIGSASGEADLRDGTALAKVRIDSRLQASLRARARWPHAFEMEADWTELALRGEEIGAEGVVITSSGGVRLRGDLEQILRQGSGRITSVRIDHPTAHLESLAAWTIGADTGVISLRGAELRGEGQRIVGEGSWSREIARLRASGEGSLALAEGIVPGLVSARGLATIDIEAWRRAGGPWRMKGKARVADAAADLGVLVGLSGVDGEVDIDEGGLWVREFAGDLGGGRFSIDGRVDRDQGFALAWHLRRANLGVPAWLDHRVTGEGTVDGAMTQPVVRGSLRVEQAVYDRDIEWGEFVPWFRRETRAATVEGKTAIAFDLRILADDGIFIDNNLAAVELSADLRLGGTAVQPTLIGRIDVVDGNIDFRGRKFTLTAGTLVFDESHLADPVLEILGEASVRTPEQEVEIDLRVSGRATEPRIEFVADDPSFTQNDVLALVTFGRTVSQLQDGGAGISLDEVLSLTAGPRANRLERGVHTLLPVDRIEIEPAYSRITGSTEPKLRIGKDLTPSLRKTPLGEALRGPLQASAGSSLGAGREQDVTLEYGLTPTVALLGSWQSDTESGAGAFGGDVKFRRQFWGLSGFSLLPETMPDVLLSPPAP